MFNRLNPEARIAVMQATDVARQLGHTEVGPDHVLLGLLANVRGETYALLNDHGLSFDSAKAIVIDRHPVTEAGPQWTEAGTDSDTDQAAAELDEDRAALRAIGIDLDKVREAVRSAFGDDITAEWGERSRRGRGRGGPEGRGGRRGRGGPRGHHHHHHHDHSLDGAEGAADDETTEDREGAPEDRRGRGGRGRRGPRSERFGERPAFSESLRDALRDTVREARLGRTDVGASDEDRRGPGGGRLNAGLLLLAISRSGDPVVDAVFKWSNDEAALRAAIAEQAGQPVS